jgi:hypothetical protein
MEVKQPTTEPEKKGNCPRERSGVDSDAAEQKETWKWWW